jgi:DNA-binding CsgD family transcriptional regulator
MKTNDITKALPLLKKFVADKSEYSEPAIEKDPDQIMSRIKFMEQILDDVVVVVCSHDRVSYVSSNCEDIIGYSNDYFRSLGLEETLGLLHADDVNGFKNCVDKMTKITAKKYDAYKYSVLYRMKNPKGGYFIIEDEKIAVESASGKFIFITLLRNVSKKTIFRGVKLIIQKKTKTTFTTIDEYVPETSSKFELSNRQLDIVALVAKGFSNQAIADRLHLSVNTVKNHKQYLFKKLKVSNSIEMLNTFNCLS